MIHRIAYLMLLLAAAPVGAQPATTQPSPVPLPINQIEREYADGIARAQVAFNDAVAVARRQRVVALTKLEDAAMANKDLNLAVAAHDAINEEVPVKLPEAATAAPRRPTFRLTIAAKVDGLELCTLRQDSATWKHVGWDPPTDVTIGGVKWDTQKKEDLHNAGATQFFPFKVDFSTARVVDRSGRDIAAIEQDGDSVHVIFEDSPVGTDDYSITIEFQAAQAPDGRGK